MLNNHIMTPSDDAGGKMKEFKKYLESGTKSSLPKEEQTDQSGFETE